jgi:sec-independent protein translocase protein TatA
MWAPSGMELIVILIVALLVFGPRKLPEIGKAVGSAVTEFKKGISGVTDEVNKVAAAEAKSKQMKEADTEETKPEEPAG